MSNENNKMQVDIENLFKQNVNDLSAIKELYRKLKEVEEKITQIKYIDSTLANKLKKIILDENASAALSNEIKTVKTKLTNDIKTINFQLNIKANDDEVVKKSQATLDDFNEETRRVILGLDEGQINAVLCEKNVTKRKIIDNEVSFKHLN